METLTVIKMNVPPTLRTSLSSTNPIESAFSVTQEKVRRVKNWRSSPDQVTRWAAAALIEAEKQFRTLRGFRSLTILEENLKILAIDNKAEVA